MVWTFGRVIAVNIEEVMYMSRGLNKAMIIGNVGQDPEMRYMPNESAVVNLSIATSESWKDKQTGEQKEKTEWHRVVMFNRLAEIATEYLRKGSQVYIEGKIQTRKWEDKEGNDRYTTEVVANEMQMLGGRSVGNTESSSYSNNDNQSAPKSDNADSSDDFDDDIPF